MGRFFLVDSGADECVFPASTSDRRGERTTDLVAANGSSIKTFGKRYLEVSFGPRPGRTFKHKFWIATVCRPILGANFFMDHGLLIDMPRRRLVLSTEEVFLATLSSSPSVSISSSIASGKIPVHK